MSFASVRFLDDQKQTGSVGFDPTTNRGSSSLWGSEIQTQRFDASVKAGYVFPLLTYQSFGFQAAYSRHDQAAYFGMRQYNIYTIVGIFYSPYSRQYTNKFKTGLN